MRRKLPEPIRLFDRNIAIDLRQKMLPWLEDIERDLGVRIIMSPGTCKRHQIQFKIDLQTIGEDGAADSPERLLFKSQHPLHWFFEDDLDKWFTFLPKNKAAKVIGIQPRKKKYPILVLIDDEEKFVSRDDLLRPGELRGEDGKPVRMKDHKTFKRFGRDCGRSHPQVACVCLECCQARFVAEGKF